jgi:hypothetical protein
MVMLYLVSYCAIRNPVCYPGFSICAPIFYLSFICDAYLLLRPGTVLFLVALLNMSRPVASDYPMIFAVRCILTLDFLWDYCCAEEGIHATTSREDVQLISQFC